MGATLVLSVVMLLSLVFVIPNIPGIIRRRSQGMLALLLTHLAADMTIFSILAFAFFRHQAGIILSASKSSEF